MGRPHVALIVCASLVLAPPASALGLLDAYQAALINDPTLRAARHERSAGQQALPVARAGLLPNASLSSNRMNNAGDRRLAPATPPQALDYRSVQDALSLRQPLFNVDSFMRYRQGAIQSDYSEAVFNKKEGELALRVAGAYFDLLLAAEKLALSEAEVTSFSDQLKLAQRRNSSGEGTVTEIAETTARLAIAETNRADATDQTALARRALEAMTGKPMGELRVLKKTLPAFDMQPPSEDEWASLALEKSPEITAQRKVLESAEVEIDRIRAGHLPRLDFVASVSKTESDSLTTLNQQATVRSAGLQLTIPLFAGLGVVAQTEQAIANRERAAAELDAMISKVQLDVRRWFLAARNGVNKAVAYERAVDAGMVALEGTKRGMAAGIRTNTDVLEAQRVLFSALRDRAQARYEFFASRLKLKAAAGTLTASDMTAVEELLESPHAGS